MERLRGLVGFAAAFFTSSSSQSIPIEVPDNVEKSITDFVQSKSFLHLHRRLYFSLFDLNHSSVVALHELNKNFIIVPFYFGSKSMLSKSSPEAIESSGPISLAEIYKFDCLMGAVARQNPNVKLVVCAGALPAARTRAVLLLGCHMILSLGVSLKRTVRAFTPCAVCRIPRFPKTSQPRTTVQKVAASAELTAVSCWGALGAAMAQGWIDLAKPFTAGAEGNDQLCMEEYLHFSEYAPLFLSLLSLHW